MNNNINIIILHKNQAWKYAAFFVLIFSMIWSFRVYINNYLTIQNSINQTQQEMIRTQLETDFIKNFELPYIQTELAQRNLMHQQQMTQEWWIIVTFTYPTNNTIIPTPQEENDQILHQWWVNFIKYQRQKNTQK